MRRKIRIITGWARIHTNHSLYGVKVVNCVYDYRSVLIQELLDPLDALRLDLDAQTYDLLEILTMTLQELHAPAEISCETKNTTRS